MLFFVLWIQLPVIRVLDLGQWLRPLTRILYRLNVYLIFVSRRGNCAASQYVCCEGPVCVNLVSVVWRSRLEMMVPGGMEVPSRSISVMLLLVWVPKLAGETAGVSVCLRIKTVFCTRTYQLMACLTLYKLWCQFLSLLAVFCYFIYLNSEKLVISLQASFVIFWYFQTWTISKNLLNTLKVKWEGHNVKS